MIAAENTTGNLRSTVWETDTEVEGRDEIKSKGKSSEAVTCKENLGDNKPTLVASESLAAQVNLTIPVTPKFRTKSRMRSNPNIVSHDEEEYQKFLDTPKFKALKLNMKILESSGDIGVPRIKKRPTTVPMSVALNTSKRGNVHLERELAKTRQKELIADIKHNPHKVMKYEPIEKASKDARPLTIPMTPKLRTTIRSEQWKSRSPAIAEEKPKKFTARKVPKVSPIVPRKERKKPTKCIKMRLHTDIRGEMRMERMKSHSQKESQVTLREEHPTKGMTRKELTLTSPRTPNLMTRKRHALAKEKLNLKREEEERREKEMQNFKAKPYEEVPVFVPVVEAKTATIPLDIKLNTEEREASRKAFEDRLLEKEMEKLAIEKEREEERKRREEEEIKEMRKKMIPKAREFKIIYPAAIDKSEKDLTTPESPQLLTKERAEKS